MTNKKAFPVGDDNAGARLDRFVSESAGVSLRAARRLVERGAATVGGSARTGGYKLRPGQTVEVMEEEWSAPGEMPRLLAACRDYAAFFKPPGLHTAAVCGSFEPSLEALLPDIAPDLSVRLVNRLDRDTSGIVLGAVGDEAAMRFREMEDAGQVDKRYLALVLGRVAGELTLSWALDTEGGSTVRVPGNETPDRLRWTLVRPVAEQGGLTLVEARISKGARHQIRAHLAHAGHPIAGDALYGGPQAASLRLHHWRVSLPGFSVTAPPAWEEVQVLVEKITEENTCG
ncbi:RluA family pseudouridine synthase [Fundidesulfovibrio terrae]|uniref:RluA family pseudouridine synthase n=1 Tax=Fundidesulfovibrio terrae TaxID=2922866 RepID=UPI001FAEB1AB|nr:RluA family pseudouridine synthase [Fundidesulfovibrio terrae]